MDYARAMCPVERTCALDADAEHLVERQSLASQGVGEGIALEILHDQELHAPGT